MIGHVLEAARQSRRRLPPARGRAPFRAALGALAVFAAGCGGGSEGMGPGRGGGPAAGSGGTLAIGGASSADAAIGSGGRIGSGGGPAAGSGGAAGNDGGVGLDGSGDGVEGGSSDGAADRGDAAPSDGGSTGGPGVVAAGVRWLGRVDLADPTRPRFSWSGSGFVARFSGTSLTLQINDSGRFIFKAVVDGVAQPAFTANAGQGSYALATGLAAGTHTLALYRQTEGSQGDSQFLALTVGGGALMDPPPAPARFIEIVGDSISCGYGTLGALADTDCFASESHYDTYGAIAARALGADLSTIAVSGQGMYRNYGGDMNNTLPMVYTRALTNDAAPLWDFRAQPQAVIINLGTNDISNNKGDPGTPFRDAYLAFVQAVRARYPGALILCTVGPLLGAADAAAIQAHIRAVVAARNTAGDANIALYDRIAPQTSDKAACQFHPNPAENQIMADQIVTELRTRLGW